MRRGSEEKRGSEGIEASGLCRGFGLSAYAILLRIRQQRPAVRHVPLDTHYEWDTLYEARAPFRSLPKRNDAGREFGSFSLLLSNLYRRSTCSAT